MRAHAAIGRRADWIVALGLAVGYQAEIWAGSLFDGRSTSAQAAAAALALLATLPLGLRRRRPAAVLVVVAAATAVGSLLDDPARQGSLAGFLALMLAFYSAGAWGDARRGLVVGAATLAASGAFFLAAEGGGDLGTAIALALAWLVGRELRRHRDAAAAERERAARLERTGEERVRATVVEERARIARELHDVVAHSVSVMVVQAQAAQRVLEGEQRTAREALGAIESSGRQALVELRRLLGLLRRASEGEDLAPQPSLQAPGRSRARDARGGAAGPDRDRRRRPLPLPPGVDLSAYRIVQEGADERPQARRRRRTPRCTSTTARTRSSSTSSTTAPATATGRAPDTGSSGIRERVALYGGGARRPAAGPRAGYRLHAWLPLGGDR